jgi:aldehyde:ferredoxin oxidoreductase
MPHWDKMLQNYYRLMGWDANGKPLPETLASLGLEDIIE